MKKFVLNPPKTQKERLERAREMAFKKLAENKRRIFSIMEDNRYYQKNLRKINEQLSAIYGLGGKNERS